MQNSVVNNNRYEILTPTGWSAFSGVRRTSKNVTISFVTRSGLTLDCTPEHPLKTDRGFIEAKDIHEGTLITTKNGYDEILAKYKSSGGEFYDALNVEKDNEYYTNDIISHNCAFLGSSGTLISGACLKTLTNKVPIVQKDGLTQYYAPVSEHQYIITVDVSRGKGLDYSAFQVIDITKMPYNQVCVYKNNMVTPIDFSEVINRIAKAYNSAAILVEINDVGQQVADTLYQDYENENIIYTENAGARGKRISAGFAKTADRGVRTTKTVKAIGCSMLKLLVEQYQLIINDHDTIWELSRFSRKGTSYEAEPGAHDDLVMCLVLFAWMSDQQYFKDLTNINTLMKLRDKTEEDIERDLVPFGIIDDGQPEEDENGYTQLPPDELRAFLMS